MNTSDLYDKYFVVTPERSVKFKGSKMIIQFPIEWIKKGIARITQTTVEAFGLFEGFIFDDIDKTDPADALHKFTMKLPCNIIMNPSHITEEEVAIEDAKEETLTKTRVYNLIFMDDDVFMKSTSLVQDLDISDKYIYLLLTGQLPQSVKYEEIPVLWQRCASMNGTGNLGSSFATLEMITMNLARDPADYTKVFRHVYEKYYAKNIRNAKMVHYYNISKYTSAFSALTGTDLKYGLTVALERNGNGENKDVRSPVEEVIS